MVAVAGGIVQSADVTALAALTTGRPLVRLIAQATQSLASATNVAIAFASGSEDIDTHNYHDPSTNNSRITPLTAGYWRFTGTLWLAGAATLTSFYVGIAKNGTNQNPLNRIKPVANSTAQSAQTTSILQMNGSGDYAELIGNQTDSGAAARLTTTGTGTVCCLEAEFLRPL